MPNPEACSGIEDTPRSDITSPPPQPAPAASPSKKRKPKGRSGGEKSSRTIKQMRKEASKGDIEAAMKLGWGVDRITDIFNRKKAARGEKVTPGQPIDDPDLLRRITERHEYQAKIQKKRQNKLRVQAEAGDFEAAKKLKLGKKRLRQLFPHLFGGELKEERDNEKYEDTYQAITLPEEFERQRTPAEPFNFATERQQTARYPSFHPFAEMMLHNGVPATYPLPGIIGETYKGWSPALKPPQFRIQVGMTPPRYPTTPPAIFDPKRALRREYDAASHQVAIAQAHLARIAHELEQLEQQEKMRIAHPCASLLRRQTIKAEDEPKTLFWHKKTKKYRPSNFPSGDITEDSQDAKLQAPAPASVPVHAMLQY